jgi:hypothetical protein
MRMTSRDRLSRRGAGVVQTRDLGVLRRKDTEETPASRRPREPSGSAPSCCCGARWSRLVVSSTTTVLHTQLCCAALVHCGRAFSISSIHDSSERISLRTLARPTKRRRRERQPRQVRIARRSRRPSSICSASDARASACASRRQHPKARLPRAPRPAAALVASIHCCFVASLCACRRRRRALWRAAFCQCSRCSSQCNEHCHTRIHLRRHSAIAAANVSNSAPSSLLSASSTQDAGALHTCGHSTSVLAAGTWTPAWLAAGRAGLSNRGSNT